MVGIASQSPVVVALRPDGCVPRPASPPKRGRIGRWTRLRLHPRRARRLRRVFPLLGRDGALVVAHGAAIHRYLAGDVVARQGRNADRLWVVLHGHLDVVDREQVVACLGPGDEYGAIHLLRAVARPCDLVARTRCSLLAVDQAGWRQLESASLATVADLTRRSHHSRADHPSRVGGARTVSGSRAAGEAGAGAVSGARAAGEAGAGAVSGARAGGRA
jgi:hypothetical protein